MFQDMVTFRSEVPIFIEVKIDAAILYDHRTNENDLLFGFFFPLKWSHFELMNVSLTEKKGKKCFRFVNIKFRRYFRRSLLSKFC